MSLQLDERVIVVFHMVKIQSLLGLLFKEREVNRGFGSTKVRRFQYLRKFWTLLANNDKSNENAVGTCDQL